MSDPTSTKIPSEVAAADGALARGFLYQLLANFLRHPLCEGVESRINEHHDQWRLALNAAPYSDKKRLEQTLKSLFTQLKRTNKQEWTTQFEQMFGHTANSKAPLYELEYGEEHTHRQPQQLADIAAFYQAFGVKIDPTKGERVDNAAAECEFLYYLCLKEAHAISDDKSSEKQELCRNAQIRFLEEHAARWLPALFGRLSKQASCGSILKQIADGGTVILLLESGFLGVELASLDVGIRPIQEQEETGCVSCVLSPKVVPS